MTTFIGVIIIIISTLFGYILSEKFAYRKNFYKNFFEFNKNLKSEVSFTKASILSIIDNKDSNDFIEIAKEYISLNEIKSQYKHIKQSEIDFIKSYLSSIFDVDDKTLLKNIDYYTVKINEIYNVAIYEDKKYRTLYVKIGFLLGLLVFVILI